MDPQPEAWVGAIGGLFVIVFICIAVFTGMSYAKNNPNPQPKKDWDLFELGESYYKPSPTNLMREIDRNR